MGKEALPVWDQEFVWHPFTPMKQWQSSEPIIIEKAQGSYLVDTQGKRYLDGVSSLWVNVHGHNHPHLNQAIKNQLEKVAHSTLLGLANVPSIELAKKLIEVAPKGLAKVFYSDSGSTSVEIALKMSFQYWQQKKSNGGVAHPKEKTKFIALKEAYHGDTIGSVSVGGMDLFHQIYQPLLFKTIQIPNPHHLARKKRITLDEILKPAAAQAREIIAKHHKEVAALIVEPRMQGAAGMLKMPHGYLKYLREFCDEFQIHLIVDEVATGFGRTGKLFACEHEGVTPDFLCLAKGISGGYLPLAATLSTAEIFEGFMGEVKDLKTFFHGHTYTGNPLACSVALASMELFEKPGFWQELEEKIQALSQDLNSLKKLPILGEIRQEGLMVGIELVKNKETLEPFDYADQMGNRVCYSARSKGLLIRPLGNILVLMPPLSITREELKKMVAIVKDCLRL